MLSYGSREALEPTDLAIDLWVLWFDDTWEVGLISSVASEPAEEQAVEMFLPWVNYEEPDEEIVS